MFDTLWNMAETFGGIIRKDQLGGSVMEHDLKIAYDMAESLPESAIQGIIITAIADVAMMIAWMEVHHKSDEFDNNILFRDRENLECVLCFLEQTKINDLEEADGFWQEMEVADKELINLADFIANRSVPHQENRERWELVDEKKEGWWRFYLMESEESCRMFETIVKATAGLSKPEGRFC